MPDEKKVHYFWAYCPDVVDGDIYTDDLKETTCAKCRSNVPMSNVTEVSGVLSSLWGKSGAIAISADSVIGNGEVSVSVHLSREEGRRTFEFMASHSYFVSQGVQPHGEEYFMVWGIHNKTTFFYLATREELRAKGIEVAE